MDEHISAAKVTQSEPQIIQKHRAPFGFDGASMKTCQRAEDSLGREDLWRHQAQAQRLSCR
jgi:hypothetical protein